ncbi:MAG: prepilin-type N-terminal cleavage/methylation domain-containing protein [Nitrospirae bacterium]|nr:prepilin-type N-terminal cleavage/methylation domain-containing protein [Nitrospirota bacterium]
MKKISRNEKGFTLIELMIVVAILGILAAIAIPNFMRFQAKSRQAESKTNLGAIGTSAESWRAEQGTYVVAAIGNLGWAPQGTVRYSYWYDVAGTATVIPLGGATYSGAGADLSASGGCNRSTAPATAAVTAAASTYDAATKGEIDSDASCDEWHYDETRTLVNDVNDVSS